MSAPPTPDPTHRRRNRLLLLAIVALFFGSLIGAGVLRFSGWRPSGMKNHGELLDPPGDLRAVAPRLADGGTYAWAPVERRWRILLVPDERCGDDCPRLARELDTVWQLLGKDARRVDVLWVCGAPGCTLPAEVPRPASLRVVQPDVALAAGLPRADDASGTPVYVVDPNGFVILRYAPGFDPAGLRADLAKLLKLK